MNKKSRWYFKFPSYFHAIGPTTKRFATEQEARKNIRKVWGLTRLPKGTEVWRASE